MLMSEAYRYEDVKLELNAYLKDMGVSENRKPEAPHRDGRHVAFMDKVVVSLIIPLVIGVALIV